MFLKTVATANALAALTFVALFVIGTLMVKLDARTKFTQLDRAGVVDARALGKFDASYGFGNVDALEYRNTVPVWLCASAISFLQVGAVLGLGITSSNALLAVAVWSRQRRKPSERNEPSHAAIWRKSTTSVAKKL